MAKKNKQPPNPDNGLVVRSSKFSGIAKQAASTELRQKIWDLCNEVQKLPGIKGITQYEEMIRDYQVAIDKGETTTLPYASDGIGSRQKRLVSCIASEVTCLIAAFWKFNEEATGPTAECVNDHLEYLGNLVADPSTLRVEDIGNCRYRAVNSRIDAGERLNEGVE